jgi:ABC-2 type transport system permease protein
MRNFGLVFAYSFKERLRSKAFTYLTLIMIVAMAGLVLVPKLTQDDGNSAKGEIDVLDRTGAIPNADSFKENVSASYDWRMITENERAGELKRLEDKETLLGIVQIENQGSQPVLSLTVNKADDAPYIRELNSYVQNQYTIFQIHQLGLGQEQQKQLTSAVQMQIQEMEAGSKSLTATYWPVYMVTFMLYLLIYMFGSNVAVSVSVEKGSRVKEILITKVKPVQLLFGKVFGVGLAGILQFAIIVGAVYLILKVSGTGGVLELFGMPVDFSILGGTTIMLLTLFFILGYFFFAALFAATGSMVSRSEEINQVTLPISILLIAGLIVAMFAMLNPDGILAVIGSYIPFFTPFVMFARIGASDLTALEIVIPTLILFVSTLAACWLSAKIYQVGVLLYGQKLNPKLLYKAIKAL